MNMTNEEREPFSPRLLTHHEQRRGDIYLFVSPKVHRQVAVFRPAALALALEYEFSPAVIDFVERPRRIASSMGETELSFWSRTKAGRETFTWIAHVPHTRQASPREEERRAEALRSAAQAAQITLSVVSEPHLCRQPLVNMNRLRLLPWVQTAKNLDHAEEIRLRVLEAFQFRPRLSFVQLESDLRAYDWRDVRAVASSLVHAGQASIDWTARLQPHSVLTMEATP
ncbi:hypothetical protein ACQQ2N_17430 [Dokdonella sp. MW10]|uniref:hypothetical protein n=1 Tax=Dokdonella sp. MW10 TaxID=2992926 RepID=UPI003F7F907C